MTGDSSNNRTEMSVTDKKKVLFFLISQLNALKFHSFKKGMIDMKLAEVAWYGPVLLGGFLYILGSNIPFVIDRIQASKGSISGDATVKIRVAPDFAMVDIVAVASLGKNAAESASSAGSKVEQFTAFLRNQKGLKFTNSPVEVSQQTLQIGEKYARSYDASQSVQLTFTDLSFIQPAIDQAIKLGMNVGKVTYKIQDEKKYRSDVRKKAIEKARLDAEEHAAQYERKLDRLESFDDRSSYDSESDNIDEDTPTESPNKAQFIQTAVFISHTAHVNYSMK